MNIVVDYYAVGCFWCFVFEDGQLFLLLLFVIMIDDADHIVSVSVTDTITDIITVVVCLLLTYTCNNIILFWLIFFTAALILAYYIGIDAVKQTFSVVMDCGSRGGCWGY